MVYRDVRPICRWGGVLCRCVLFVSITPLVALVSDDVIYILIG